MLDPVLLRSFIAVADAGSFTRAAEQLHLTQSAVSAHLRRLEGDIGHRLFERTTRAVSLTPAGRRLSGYARSILALTTDARLSLGTQSTLAGRVRVGASEGMAKGPLVDCLRRFGAVHEGIEIGLRIGLMGDLLDSLDRGELDIVLGSRCGDDRRGDVLWSEPLVWGAAIHFDVPAGILPLAVYPDACPYRAAAIEALARVRRNWRIACQSSSGDGLLITVMAGLGVMPMTRSTCQTAGLREVEGLPSLPDAQFALVGGSSSSAAVTALTDDVRHCMRDRARAGA